MKKSAVEKVSRVCSVSVRAYLFNSFIHVYADKGNGVNDNDSNLDECSLLFAYGFPSGFRSLIVY